MRKGYKVVVNTAAGRRRYMQYLIPQVVSSPIVDRYDLWLNTTNKEDLSFFEYVADKIPKVNLVWQPDNTIDGVRSINAFYKTCCEEDIIYFKLDDDMIWLEPDLFEKMVDFRLEHPEFFLVSPFVINNGICNYLLQLNNKITYHKYYAAEAYNRMWYNGFFAEQLHEWFLYKYLLNNQYSDLYDKMSIISLNRYAINAVLWFGKTFRQFGGEVLGDDEEFLTVIKPAELGVLGAAFNGQALCSHFSFSAQRRLLDKTNILNIYGNYLENQDRYKEYFKIIKEALAYLDKNQEEIRQKHYPYKQVVHNKKISKYKWGEKLVKLREEYKYIYLANKKYILER